MSEPLFRRVLGAQFERLPAVLQAFHDRRRDSRAVGRCNVVLGRSRLARILAFLLSLPPAGDDLPLAVDFVLRRDGETWRRDFAGAPLVSHLRSGRGALQGFLLERRFPLAVAMRLSADESGLSYVPHRYWLMGLPWPPAFAPRADARETAAGGIFAFDVTLALPFVGMLMRYRGSLHLVSGEEAVGKVGAGNHAVVPPAE